MEKKSKLKFYNFEQGTDEWFNIRKWKLTASHATAIGNIGKGLETYCKKVVMESISSNKDNWSNKDTQRGNELEPIARQIYELENDVTVNQVGFIELNEFVGCSPDGLIGEDGGLEIKSPDDKEYFEYLLGGEDAIKSDYIWQVQMNLLITERKWWDLAIYNPGFPKTMLVFRIYPDLEKFKLLEQGFEVGKTKIVEIKNKINL